MKVFSRARVSHLPCRGDRVPRRRWSEHLLMIGGPNDVVIESDIIRAESRDTRDLRKVRIRGKELRDAPPLPAGISWPSPAEAPLHTQNGVSSRRRVGVGDRVDGHRPHRGIRARFVLPTQRRPVFPLPPRRMPPPARPSVWPRNIESPEPLHNGAGQPQKPELGTAPAKGYPRVATPFSRPPALRQVQGTAAKPNPSGTSETPPADALAPSSFPGFEEIPTSAAVDVARRADSSAPAPDDGPFRADRLSWREDIEARDKSPAATALCEAQEEIGLDAGHVERLGYLDPYPTGPGFSIAPVVAKPPHPSPSRSSGCAD